MKQHLQLLNRTQSERFIKLVEANLPGTMQQLETLEPKFREIETKYFREKEIYDALKKSYEDDQQTLKFLKGMLTNTKPDNVRNLLRATSHLDEIKKKEGKRKYNTGNRITWSEDTIKVLTDANHFMKEDALFSAVIETDAAAAEYANRKSKGAARSNWRVSLGILKRPVLNKALIIYKEKFGLKVWTENGIPKPQYMREFVFNEGIAKAV